VGFVFFIEVMPEGGASGVEHQGQMLGLPLPEYLEEHSGHPVSGVGGNSTGVGQGRQGMKGPIEIGTDVNEIQDAGFFVHGGILFHLIATPVSPVNLRRLLGRLSLGFQPAK
jgi:hypothetical protein